MWLQFDPFKTYEFSPKYWRAIRVSFAVHFPVWFLTLFVLDMGQTNRACEVAMLCQWITNMLVVLRRPQTPTSLDLIIIRYGFVPIFLIAIVAGEIRTAYAIENPYSSL